MTDSRSQPNNVDALRKQAFDLSCNDQYRLATFIAENVGYWLAPELDHPDSPHQSMTSPSQPTSPSVDAEELARSMPGEIELSGIIHDSADDGMGDHCSWSMANRAAEAVYKRLSTVALSAPRVEPDAERLSVNEYVADYEYRGDQDYVPTEDERAMLEDAIEGYLSLAPTPSQPDTGMLELVDAVQALLSDKSVTYAVRCNRVVKALAALPPDAGERK